MSRMKEIEIKGLNEKVFEHTTKEGLKVYIWQNEKIKSTYMSLTVRYGAIDTHFKVGNKTYHIPYGVAHFLEHVKFNMDKDTTAHDIFTSIGGEANAFTTYKYTSYIVFAAQKIKENLDTLLDFVYTPYFTKPLINKEKGIIVEESRMGLDDPYSTSFYAFLKQVFHRSNYRYEITGLPDDINSITIDDVKNAYNSFYHPENMFLIVTGNVNPYEIVKIVDENLAKKEFGKFVKPKVTYPKEEKTVAEKYQELKLNISSPELRYAIKIPRKNFKNVTDQELGIYLTLIDNINFGISSDFRQELQNKELFSSFNMRANLIEDYVILTFYAETDYAKEIEKAIDKKLTNLDINEEDFNRKRKADIANLILKYDDIVAVNETMQSELIYEGHVVDNMKEILENLDIKKMQEVADTINVENKAVMTVVPK